MHASGPGRTYRAARPARPARGPFAAGGPGARRTARRAPAISAAIGAAISAAIAVAIALLSGVAGISTALADGEPGSDPQAPLAGTLVLTDHEPQPWIALNDLARALQAERVVAEETVVLRAGGVVVTGRIGSAEVTVGGDVPAGHAGERSLSAPLRREGNVVRVPLDAAGLFGADRIAHDRLRVPSGRVWALRIVPAMRVRTDPGADLLHPAPGVTAVELRTSAAGGAAEALAAWVVDLTMAPLAAPWMRAAVDAALREAGDARALLLVVTSTEPAQRHPGLTLRPDGATAWTEPGARHETILGTQDAIGPESPWVAVVWLPPGTRLDRPLGLAVDEVRATVTFRR